MWFLIDTMGSEKGSQKFCNILYVIVSGTFFSIVVDSAKTYCTLLRTESDLKATQVNMQRSLIPSDFELNHYDVKATKIICCVKGEDALVKNTVTRWLKKFHTACKKSSMIWIGRVGLKSCVLSLCSKVQRKIRWVTSGECQASSATHNPVRLIIFTTLAIESRTVEFCLSWVKYCQILIKLKRYDMLGRAFFLDSWSYF